MTQRLNDENRAALAKKEENEEAKRIYTIMNAAVGFVN